MKEKGFTLIELLAVIVVLAIIALIAVPIVLNIIEDARRSAAVSSARSYIKATETYVVSSELNKKDTLLKNNKYNVTKTTTIGDKTYQAINDLVEIKGTKPNGSEDYITLGDNYQVIEAKLTINGYEILIKNDEVISIAKGKIIEVESIAIDKTNENIEIGSTLQLNATVTPSNATNKTVTWTSSDESIATVDSNGLVTGVKAGSVTITATTNNGKSATVSITVYKTEILATKVKIGDYVAYDAGTWTETKEKPTSQGEFGGYTVGQNKANSVSMCQSGYTTVLRGWRVLSVDKDTNTVTIIHAGQSECYYHASSHGDASVISLNNRAVSEYLNYSYANSAHMMDYDETVGITESISNTTNNLRNIGAVYWLSTQDSTGNLYYVYDDGSVNDHSGSIAVGVRPVVVLKSNIKTTGKTTDAVGQEAWSLVAP